METIDYPVQYKINVGVGEIIKEEEDGDDGFLVIDQAIAQQS